MAVRRRGEGDRIARAAVGLLAGLLASTDAAAGACEPWPGEPAPLPGTADPDPMRARWAELRVGELERRALANEVGAPGEAHSLWSRVLCLAPERDSARRGAERTRPVRIHRPEVATAELRVADDSPAFAGLSRRLRVASRAKVDPELALQWRAAERARLLADIDQLMGETESQLRAARFDEALAGSREVRVRLAEMRRADDLPPRWAQLGVLEATALVAMGRDDEARASMAGALAADPELSLDPGATSPKVLRVLEAAREAER